MGSLPEPSNEQKLTYIYQVLKAQESRRRRKTLIGLLKWAILIALLTFIYIYRYQIIDQTYKYIADGINARVRKISEEQKAGILKGIQQLIPPSLETTLKDVQKIIVSGTGDLIPARGWEPAPGEKTGTTKTPAKK